MRMQRGWPAALVAALGVAGCGGGGPTAPKATDTFALVATMSDTAGTPTMVEAAVNLDNQTVADSCPPADQNPVYDSNGFLLYYSCSAPAVSTYTFSGTGGIGAGSHSLQFFVSTQTTGNPVTYTVSAFNVMVYDVNGKPLKTVPFPAQTAALSPGQGIAYSFSF